MDERKQVVDNHLQAQQQTRERTDKRRQAAEKRGCDKSAFDHIARRVRARTKTEGADDVVQSAADVEQEILNKGGKRSAGLTGHEPRRWLQLSNLGLSSVDSVGNGGDVGAVVCGSSGILLSSRRAVQAGSGGVYVLLADGRERKPQVRTDGSGVLLDRRVQVANNGIRVCGLSLFKRRARLGGRGGE